MSLFFFEFYDKLMGNWRFSMSLAVDTLFKFSPGVYLIRNTINQKVYVGSSEYLGKRLLDHASMLRTGKHTNTHLQRAWDKYGDDSFVSEIVEHTSVDQLNEREQAWINKLNATNQEFGYNIAPEAGSNRGFTFDHTEDGKRKISMSKKGVPLSKEHCQKLSEARKSYQQSRETIEKARVSNTGKKRSSEAKENMKRARHASIEKSRATLLKTSGRNNASGFKGVYQKGEKWQAKINLPSGGDKSVGVFETKEEAAKNYDFHMRKLYGGECFLNFPHLDFESFTPRVTLEKPEEMIRKDTAIVNVIYNTKSSEPRPG
jgi:group I intron endonuclease